MYAECSSALVGMQPMFTHTPPSFSCSTTAVLSPSCAQRMAQTYPAGPPPRTMTSKDCAKIYSLRGGLLEGWTVGTCLIPTFQQSNLQQHSQRVLEHLFQSLQIRGARCPVDHPVITAHRDPQPAPHDDAIAVGHGLRDDAADRDDAGLGRIDDGGELIDVEHPKVRDAERRAGVLLRLQAPGLGTPRQLARLRADLPQALQVRIADYRRDEPVLDRDRHPDVYLVPVADVILLEPGVAGAMLDEGQRHGFDDDVVERDLPAFFT